MSTIINATTTNGVVIQPDNSGSLVLQTNNGTTAVTIDTSQNVGIGTTSPAFSGSRNGLVVKGNTTNGGEVIVQTSVDTGSTGLAISKSGVEASLFNRSNGLLSFGTNDTERMRIDSNGNVSVGTSNTGAKLTVYASSQASMDVRTTTTSDGILGYFNTGGSSGSAVYVFPCRFGSTQFFAGGVYWSGSVMQYTGTSDFRLKENIVDAGSGLEKLSKVKIRSFDWKESGNHVDFGVIAQELEDIAPEAVAKGRDNEDGSINTPYAVDTSILVPAMIKAIQEQQTIINDLKARIETLEAK